ncbi:Uncharacterized protein HZ326_30464 [Fusarium oxysporum f. sp. albedinis]|nr:Uncharacterized protein HZ326_30464 [Fusarium oxysporum f. sp. albedinis]
MVHLSKIWVTQETFFHICGLLQSANSTFRPVVCKVCMYVYFSSGGPSAPKVPYLGTGRAELEKSESIYTLFTEMRLATKDWSLATRK